MTTSPMPGKKLKLLAKPELIQDQTERSITEIDPRLREEIRRLVLAELPWPFFLTGDPGVGKSAAMLCLADHVHGSVYYRFTRFLKAFQFANTVRGIRVMRWNAMSDKPDAKIKLYEDGLDEQAFWDYLINSPLVVIDDLATRGGYTQPQYDLFYDLVEERKTKPLVIVSNVPLVGLREVFDERILSRIARGTLYTLSGRDRRLDGKISKK